MLSLSDIQEAHNTSEKTVEIEAFGGEVRIKQLTVSQSADVVSTQSKTEHVLAMVKTASYALVEPKISVDEMEKLSQTAFDGIKQIVDAVGEFSEPKK